jgi:hypothetical protein
LFIINYLYKFCWSTWDARDQVISGNGHAPKTETGLVRDFFAAVLALTRATFVVAGLRRAGALRLTPRFFPDAVFFLLAAALATGLVFFANHRFFPLTFFFAGFLFLSLAI